MGRYLDHQAIAIPKLARDRQLLLISEVNGLLVVLGLKHLDPANLTKAVQAIQAIRDHRFPPERGETRPRGVAFAAQAFGRVSEEPSTKGGAAMLSKDKGQSSGPARGLIPQPGRCCIATP